MEHFPIITIATVTYNAESTLQRTLDSVAKQTYQHIEHLIIDGCSKDLTTEIIHHYVNENAGQAVPHDIRFIREPDNGLYDAMNKALTHASGDYIVFLNAGDTLHSPHTIEQIFSSITSPYPAIVYGETDIVDENGAFLRHRRLQAPEQLHWKDLRWGMLVCHQSFYVRTDLAKQELYNLRYRYSADFDWWGTGETGLELTATVSNSTDGDWLTVTAPKAGTGTSASLFSMSITAAPKKFNVKARRATVTISDNVGFSREIIVYQGDHAIADEMLAVEEVRNTGKIKVTADAERYNVIYPTIYKTLNVYNVSGHLMNTKTLSEDGVVTIDAQSWTNGVYLLKFTGNGKTQTIKVVR